MLEKYENLNYEAKEFFTEELDNLIPKEFDKHLLEQCYIEMNMLYENGLLFIIEYLYKYHLENPEIKYYFKGMINNLLFLYVLRLSEVDPLKYHLPYELFNDKKIDVYLINGSSIDLAIYLEKCSYDFKLVAGSFEKEDIEEINELEKNHYLIIPAWYHPKAMLFKLNEFGMFETNEDYRNYRETFLTIRIDEKNYITNYQTIEIGNVISNEFESNLAKILLPKSIDDYAKIKSLAQGAKVWLANQDRLFDQGKINIQNIIATREDVYEYLLEHSIESFIALDIVKYLYHTRNSRSNRLWNKYVTIMKKHNCEESFIEIISKILYISGRGQAVSECLFALDKSNYYEE